MSPVQKLPRATLEQKIQILNYYHQSGKPQSETVENFKNKFSISTSSFSEWLKNEQELRERYSSSTNITKNSKRKVKFKYEKINQAMDSLVKKRLQDNMSVSEPILREYWSIYAHQFGVDDPKRLVSFSHGWLSQFKKRHGLDRKSMNGDSHLHSLENNNSGQVLVNGDSNVVSVTRNLLSGIHANAAKDKIDDNPNMDDDYSLPLVEREERYTHYEVNQLLNQSGTSATAQSNPAQASSAHHGHVQGPVVHNQNHGQHSHQQAQQQSQNHYQSLYNNSGYFPYRSYSTINNSGPTLSQGQSQSLQNSNSNSNSNSNQNPASTSNPSSNSNSNPSSNSNSNSNQNSNSNSNSNSNQNPASTSNSNSNPSSNSNSNPSSNQNQNPNQTSNQNQNHHHNQSQNQNQFYPDNYNPSLRNSSSNSSSSNSNNVVSVSNNQAVNQDSPYSRQSSINIGTSSIRPSKGQQSQTQVQVQAQAVQHVHQQTKVQAQSQQQPAKQTQTDSTFIVEATDLEKFIFMFADKFFNENAEDYPVTKKVFEDLKASFLNERVSMTGSSGSGSRVLEDFYIRGRNEK